MADNNRKPTTTQVRTMFSNEMSSLRIMFYNMNLSLQFQPYTGKDQNGFSKYDYQNGITTTIGWAGAFALHKVAVDIINGREAANGITVFVPCNDNVIVTIERKAGSTGQMESLLTITKNGQVIPFKFEIHKAKQMENGQMVDKIIESGLGAFSKTLEGYLTGINADRHLDKLTDDYVKSLGDKAQGGGFQTGSGYNKGGNNNYRNNNGNYKKPYNNYKNNYNNNQGGGQQQSWESQGQNQQNASNYNLPQ